MPQIAPGFTLVTALAHNDSIARLDSGSLSKLSAMVEQDEYYTSVFDKGYGREDWLKIMVAANRSRLIDTSTPQCSFSSDYFVSLLKLSALQPVEPEFVSGSLTKIIQGSRSVAYLLTIDDVWQASIGDDAYGFGNYTYIGLPEVGNVVSPDMSIAMSTESLNKDKCWSFIREFLLEGSRYVFGIPLRRDGAEAQMQKELEVMKSYPVQHEGRQQAMQEFLTVWSMQMYCIKTTNSSCK